MTRTYFGVGIQVALSELGDSLFKVLKLLGSSFIVAHPSQHHGIVERDGGVSSVQDHSLLTSVF